jgi:DedD protein
MDKALKQRMVGAVVLIALGVIFIPMLLDGGSGEDGERRVELEIPAAPDRDYRSRRLPLDERNSDEVEESRGQVDRESEPAPAEGPRAGADQGAALTDADEPERSADADSRRDSRSDETTDDDEGDVEPAPPEPESQIADRESDSGEAVDKSLGNWFVQVGSFSREANALELRDRLRGADYSAFVERSTVEGNTKHRVKVGPEMNRSRAETQRDKIQSEFDLKGIVISEP